MKCLGHKYCEGYSMQSCKPVLGGALTHLERGALHTVTAQHKTASSGCIALEHVKGSASVTHVKEMSSVF